MTRGQFVVGLVSELPEAASLVAEHLDDQDGELLLHLLLADLRRFIVDCWKHGDRSVVRRSLALLDAALTTGDDYVQNAVGVSFVEDIGWWEADMQSFIATWPTALSAEVERQRTASG